MTTHDDQLARWLAAGPESGSPAALEAALARVPEVGQRPAWVVALRGGTLAARPVDRRLRLGLAVALAVVAIVGGALYFSGATPSLPWPDASLNPTPFPTLEGTPAPVAPADVIVFTEWESFAAGEAGCTARFRCTFTWVAVVNADGSGPRRLFPDGSDRQTVVAVSPDGQRVLVTGVDPDVDPFLGDYYLTDILGAEPVRLDTGCDAPCTGDSIGRFAFSPDGRFLAFARSLNDRPGQIPDGGASLIAILDVDTGQVTELASTLALNPDLGDPCHAICGQGSTEDPRWSPDGRHLLFSRSSVGKPGEPRTILDTQLFVVDANGANLRQLVPTELFARDAQWSPDGSLIAFTSAIETLSLDDFGLLENWHQLNDIYTARPDGTDIRRLTSFTAGPVPEAPGDLGAQQPTWTRDGRIVFQRRVGDPADPGSSASGWELWAMAADGTEATLLGTPDAPTLTELGCVVCAFPVPDWGDPVEPGFWRPNP